MTHSSVNINNSNSNFSNSLYTKSIPRNPRTVHNNSKVSSLRQRVKCLIKRQGFRLKTCSSSLIRMHNQAFLWHRSTPITNYRKVSPPSPCKRSWIRQYLAREKRPEITSGLPVLQPSSPIIPSSQSQHWLFSTRSTLSRPRLTWWTISWQSLRKQKATRRTKSIHRVQS